MKREIGLIATVFPLLVMAGCASAKYEAGRRAMHQPINCATAEADIRMLKHEKAHVEDQLLAGVQAIVPASAVVGLVTGTEGGKVSMATGDYNAKIDERIAEIKQHCGLE